MMFYLRSAFRMNVRCLNEMFSDWGRRLGGQDLKAEGVFPHASRDNCTYQPQESDRQLF